MRIWLDDVRVWLDDMRPMKDGYDIWVRTAKHCMMILQSFPVAHISFDHDLGHVLYTGATVADFIEAMARAGMINKLTWDIHSGNSAGARYIELAMLSAERYFTNGE